MQDKSFDTPIQVYTRYKDIQSIDTHSLFNSDLSYAAAGMLQYMIVRSLKNPDYVVRMADLRNRQKPGKAAVQKKQKCGRDMIQGLMRELQAHGYAILIRNRNPDGTIVNSSWAIAENPEDLRHRMTENPFVDSEASGPQAENPSDGKPGSILVSTNSTTNNVNTNVFTSDPVGEVGKSDFEEAIEEFVDKWKEGPLSGDPLKVEQEPATSRDSALDRAQRLLHRVGVSSHWIPETIRNNILRLAMLDNIWNIFPEQDPGDYYWKRLANDLKAVYLAKPGKESSVLVRLIELAENSVTKRHKKFASVLKKVSDQQIEIRKVPRYRSFMTDAQCDSETFCDVWERWLNYRASSDSPLITNASYASNFLTTLSTRKVEQQIALIEEAMAKGWRNVNPEYKDRTPFRKGRDEKLKSNDPHAEFGTISYEE